MKRGVKIRLKKVAEYVLNKFALRLAYKAYEKWLWRQIEKGPMPYHVAIIPDGNRRWAREMGLTVFNGHEAGYRKVKELLKWLWELGIKVVTIYAMSYENCLYRSPEEKEHLFKLINNGLKEFLESEDPAKYGVRVKVFGRLDLVPDYLKETIKKVEEGTCNNNERFLNVALCYGGRQEIIDGIKKLINDVKKGALDIDSIDEELFSDKYLYTSWLPKELKNPDLVIRTSGEIRISNFLLWQSAYSEFYFCEVYWPEFRKIDLWRAIRSYQHRERRFGR